MTPNAAHTRRILALALPIIGGMVSQNVLNLVDTAMVGALGNDALAAVGIASFANFALIAFITGMSAGVQAMASRWLGAGRHGETAVALNGGLLLALSLAVPWSFVLFFLAPEIVAWLVEDASVAADGGAYLRVRVLGVAAVGMNFAFRGYWNAVNLSRLYMGTLALMHVINIFLNWTLIFGNLGAPALGVVGAGVGTTVATYVGTVCYFVLGWRHARKAGFLSGVPERATLATMVRISVPAGTQQFFFASGMTAFFWILGRMGTQELAAGHVLVHVMLVAILPAMGFGLAAASLVGQSLGEGDRDEAAAWAWRVGRVAMLVVGAIGLPVFVFPDAVLGVFIRDAATLDLARAPVRVVALSAPVEALGMVLMNSHLGAGNTRPVLFVSMAAQWLLFLPAAYLLGVVFGVGLFAVWLANGGYRMLTLAAFAALWRGGRWADVKI